MAGEFWLSDEQWCAIAPLLPQPSARSYRLHDTIDYS